MNGFQNIRRKALNYLKLIKSLQTLLLLMTGVAGFVSSQCPFIGWEVFVLFVLSLFLTISGTTVLNMVWDKDIDAHMQRTAHRPLPSGEISIREGWFYGVILMAIGLLIGFYLSFLYGLILFAGFFIDFFIYTFWLKRTSSWSIVWGGISGGMPILAGRVLGAGQLDAIGILLSLAIILWIPTHIMTFNIRYYKDYKKARIPTFASSYGLKVTRVIIALSAIASVLAFALGVILLGLVWTYLSVFIISAVLLISYSLYCIYKSTDKSNFILFKAASLFMVSVMIVIIIGLG